LLLLLLLSYQHNCLQDRRKITDANGRKRTKKLKYRGQVSRLLWRRACREEKDNSNTARSRIVHIVTIHNMFYSKQQTGKWRNEIRNRLNPATVPLCLHRLAHNITLLTHSRWWRRRNNTLTIIPMYPDRRWGDFYFRRRISSRWHGADVWWGRSLWNATSV